MNPPRVTCPVCNGNQTVGIEFDCWRCGGIGTIVEGSELAVNPLGLVLVVAFLGLVIYILSLGS